MSDDGIVDTTTVATKVARTFEKCGEIVSSHETEAANRVMRIPEGPVMLPDGREILVQEWEPLISVDAPVRVRVTGMLREAPSDD